MFYDIVVRLANCPSARTPIVALNATAPVISLNGSTLSSSKGAGNQWYLNGNIIPGAIGQTHNAIATGNYKVISTDNFGCALESNEISVTVTGIPNIDPAAISLRTLPNPSDGRFTIDFTVTTRSDLQLSMTNMLGQEVYKVTYPGFSGRFTKQMELQKLSPGVYLLKVYHNRKNYLKKIIIK
jgi:hypothetical protein